MKWKQWITGLSVIFLLALFAHTASGGDISIAVGDITGTEELGNSLNKSYSVKILNSSSEILTSISLKVLKAPDGINVIDDSVTVSSVDANNYVITEDSFILSVQNGTLSPGSIVTLKWLIDYSDSVGTHQQVIETISTY